MTAIAGLVHEGRVHLAGDAAGVGGYSLTIRKDVKVFTHPQREVGRPEIPDHWVIGYTTSFRMGQILQYHLSPPVVPEGVDLHRFMCTTFVDEMRKTFKEAGWAREESGIEETGTFLVGTCGRLFIVDSDYQVGEAADGYAAVGCGSDLALGALYATADSDLDPRGRLELALRAAVRHNAGVAPPFTFVSAGGHS
ncbi:hypothetical protein [Nocardiopsis synnemataformans]|uniref:hypothetical protein n=1 Tax=Nocardiopsis synnemataformans TaxID=61305 RepID=UPI003EB72A2D